VSSLEEQIARVVEETVRRVLREERQGATTDALTTEEAARLAGVSVKTIQAWAKAGEITARRRGRRLVIMRDDLLRHLSGESAPEDPVVASLRRSA
jgi:excisionase family DNA binding protein